jgi:SAM-dependent methyltransferase
MTLYADEKFKPIPVRRDKGLFGSVLFYLRLLLDLQLLTCMRFLAPRLAHVQGSLLDVGCGEMPFRALLALEVTYVGIDVPAAHAFGMMQHPEIIAFDGTHIPFQDAVFDCVLCTEVLEHVEEYASLIAEMARVLKPGGRLLVTVPFAARVHHAPHDFYRFTRFRLQTLFKGFGAVEVIERGDDLAVIANKLIVVTLRLARPVVSVGIMWRLPILLVLMPFVFVALMVAHLSIMLGWGSRTDPLGYGVVAVKD